MIHLVGFQSFLDLMKGPQKGSQSGCHSRERELELQVNGVRLEIYSRQSAHMPGCGMGGTAFTPVEEL